MAHSCPFPTYIAVKLQRAQDALHRHETDEAKECSANKSLAKECPSEGSSIYEDVPESSGSLLAKAKVVFLYSIWFYCL
ncbi:hypothetical protein Y032_0332g2780 [Ancylostoma ceylanicum]|uniref:Uncharacterized protein n=1 Tax=Ancylostoma ceylanicum TaxID=53326 RepID=A0A016RZ64_9BILA|nr:hypothetical protein Y032_0332g2780 [Ancylostoma ceylanicum]